jgi:hypothetical protein
MSAVTISFYVSDLNAAVAHLRLHGVQVLGGRR